MKKTFKNIRTLAALLIASAAFTACSNEDSAIIGEQPAQQQAPQVFTLTLQAGKTDGAGTRALALDGTKLVAKWEAGDEVTVVKGTTPLGTLTASNVSADGNTCTLSGALGTAPSANDALTLTYHPVASLSAYTSQTGTLASAANYDVATATVTVASVSDGKITINETSATFFTQTAVLKLTLKDVADNALKATSLKISAGGADIFTFTPTDATYTANGDGILYFALPSQAAVETAKSMAANALASVPITFTATVGSDTYTATKTGYKLAGGKYYASELKMAKTPTIITWTNDDLSSGSGSSFTKGGITMSVTGTCNWELKNFRGNGTFTSTVGNFTKIEVIGAMDFVNMGSGWTVTDLGSSLKATWTGTASSTVSFGNGDDMDGIEFAAYPVTMVFTLE